MGGLLAVRVDADIEVGRPVGVAEGAFLEANLAPTVGQMPLAPGRYQWRATIGDQTWSRTFTVRAPVGQGFGTRPTAAPGLPG